MKIQNQINYDVGYSDGFCLILNGINSYSSNNLKKILIQRVEALGKHLEYDGRPSRGQEVIRDPHEKDAWEYTYHDNGKSMNRHVLEDVSRMANEIEYMTYQLTVEKKSTENDDAGLYIAMDMVGAEDWGLVASAKNDGVYVEALVDGQKWVEYRDGEMLGLIVEQGVEV